MSRNQQLFDRAKARIPGGVNSPVRAFGSVGGTPRFIARANGAFVWDADGQRFIDYVGSWGPAILGHAHPEVVAAVQEVAVGGLSFGAPTEGEIDLAEEICRLVPSIEQVRLVSSGTEATMSAIRLARGFTGRDTIVKFEGCYHGHSDSLLVKAGSGLLTFGTPSSGGVPQDFTKHTLVLEYNNVEQLKQTFAEIGTTIACVILEPFAGNMNLIKPSGEFVRALRELTEQSGTVLIYDEVMTGFRVDLHCAQHLHGIKPDMTTLGKVVGGGMPLAAFGGRADIMACIAPLGSVYQAGTLSGNPLAVTAGLTTLRLIQRPDFHLELSKRTERLAQGISEAARRAGVPMCADSVGGMFGLYMTEKVPSSFAEVSKADISAFKRFFHGMLEKGVYLAPSAFEAGFVSDAHSESLIEETIALAAEVLKAL
ncbi:glutamate-1-semialdehyde 2,1-aminomutase [Paludibacterium purpuratum]|uniref:Glutamate-1-semialdehyde 2,1-aminomutase n=1 Tax=Paludibacterium purpuratum TaxID=1144873 RepID=A0A4R7B0A2_9NEIS|nr:glutamate-1-semialdehyde 2,1-aminomutase [Paludibacterium purpuratum]TDR72475.1 glutamate-1-semialdehyde 2,1-aminomutase [Paludibacterium purpuratum]